MLNVSTISDFSIFIPDVEIFVYVQMCMYLILVGANTTNTTNTMIVIMTKRTKKKEKSQQ